MFHPQRPVNVRTPSAFAMLTWHQFPQFTRPHPEVFTERNSGVEPGRVPVATQDCAKLLLDEGRWPVSCPPGDAVPAACLAEDALCYANRKSLPAASYRFQEIPRVAELHIDRSGRAWPSESETVVRDLLVKLQWREMQALPFTDPRAFVRAIDRINWIVQWQADDRLFVYVHTPQSGANLTLQLPQTMTGRWVDPSDGAGVGRVELLPPVNQESSIVALPVHDGDLVLILTALTRRDE